MTTSFEDFALNHEQHHHCQACGACLLRQDIAALAPPWWCSGCAVRLCKTVPAGVPLPFEYGTFMSAEALDAFCNRKAAELRGALPSGTPE